MEEETFSDPKIKALLERAILVRLDVDKKPPQAATYGVESIPRLILLPAGGGRPLMDTMGFMDAEQLAQELRPALGLKAAAPTSVADTPELIRVRQALETSQYAALRASDPKAVAAGLDRLVEQLGATKESGFVTVAALVRKSGEDAAPALIRGMGHSALAVRMGAFRALQEMFQVGRPAGSPAFDPWAKAAVRKKQVQSWELWWAARKPVKKAGNVSS
jgi:thioredoxin-like negative regulator of GroEL